MVLRRPACLLAFAAWGAVPAWAQTPPATLDCTTTFTKTADEASLVRVFGRANVATVKLDGAEGSTETGTAIFPKDPARRIEIFWHDVAKRRRPATVRVGAKSSWAVALPGDRRLAPGATLADVEAANGRAFLVNGFGWDMGGYGAGWKGGALEKAPGGCYLSVRFDPGVAGKALDKVSGDRQLASTNAALRAVKPTLSEVSLGWPE